MKINADNLVSISEANKNFSKIARMADKKGSSVILKNNKISYLSHLMVSSERRQSMNADNILFYNKT
ncbi:MAG: type II toxin-antitoxin system Phd/YefM family antitoxin [Anaerococcus hydrogenalis]|nr:type II toxin-antitoxin system Phd/YefM family antitoxin [Anaerococcus hydrogenalis]